MFKGPITSNTKFQNRAMRMRKHSSVNVQSPLFPSHPFSSQCASLYISGLQWLGSKPRAPHQLTSRISLSLTPSRLNNGLPVLVTSKNTQNRPQNHPSLVGRKSSFSKEPISAACHSPWKVDLDIDSVVTYVWEYVSLIHLPFFSLIVSPWRLRTCFLSAL